MNGSTVVVTLERNILRDIAHVLHVLSQDSVTMSRDMALKYRARAADLEKRLVQQLIDLRAL